MAAPKPHRMASYSRTAYYRPFPVSALNPFHGGKLAWRLGGLAEWALSKASAPQAAKKPLCKINYATMAGRAHLLQLRESLITVARTWSALPRLTVLSDGSWAKEEFESLFQWWPQEVRLLSPTDVRTDLQRQGNDALADFTATHPLSLKLGLIVGEASRGPCMFVDSDILWFRNPVKFLSSHDWCAGVASTTEAYGCFNRQLAEAICPEVLTPPLTNSGCVLLAGRLFSTDLQLEAVLRKITVREHEFNEQTIIAIAVRLCGQSLSPEFLINDFSEPLAWRPKYLNGRHGFARHYVRFMRHLLYRDALLLRLKNSLSLFRRS